MEKERITFLDYVRVLACFLVILVHASENFYAGPDATDMAGPTSFLANETDRLWVSVYDGFSRMSVPLFMIISAYLLTPMKEGITSWHFYKHRFLRVLPPVFIFYILYSTLPMLWGQISWDTASKDLSRILLNFPTLGGHFWFMYPLIGIYLFIPIISPWLRKATAAEERFFLLLFVVSTCIPFLNRFCGEVWGQCFWNEYHMLWNFSGYLGYLVMAHYIRQHLQWSCTRKLVIGTTALLAGAMSTILSFYLQATPGTLHSTPVIEVGWAFCTPTVLCLTGGCFLLMSCINGKAPAIITNLSKLSFGIYLMHIFWLGMWVNLLKPLLPTVAAIPAIAICTFICCAITSKVISHIPGSKYIIG